MADIPLGVIIVLILAPAVYTPFIASKELRGIIFKRWYWIFTALVPILVSLLLLILAFIFANKNAAFSRQIWFSLIFILILIDFVAANVIWYLFNTYDGLIRLLEAETVHSLKISGKLNKKSISDFLELGIKSDSWQTRNLILSSLARIVDKTCSHSDYKGESLDALSLKLVDILDDNSPGSLQNFFIPVDIVRSIIFKNKEREIDAGDDIYDAIVSLGNLSQIVMRKPETQTKKIDDIVFRYIDILDMTATMHSSSINQVSQVLYEIGILAISKNLTHIGFVVVNKLYIVVSRDSLSEKIDKPKIASYALGMIAHLWSDNVSIRMELTKKADSIIPYIGYPIGKALDESMSYFKNIMRFETADKLLTMKTNLLNSKKNSRKKSEAIR